VTYKTGDWIYWHLIHSTWKYSAIADLHTSQFTAAYALGFSDFTRLIQATDLSHWHLKSHMKPSFHGLTPFLSLFCNCQLRRLESIQCLCSYSGRLASRNSTLQSTQLIFNSPSLSLMLRPTVSQPVCPGIKHPSKAYDQMFITVRQLRVVDMGRSLWRENRSIYSLSPSLIIRPTVSRPVCPGIKHPYGAYDQIFITVIQLRVCWYKALSLTSGWVCRL
jgi:hypothetical protein